MEEKLYFKPAKYGKGIRKEKIKKESKDEKGHRIRSLIFFLVFVVAIVLIVLWLLHGRTTTTGQYPENIRNESLECELSGVSYEKLNTIKPESSELKITMVFYGEDRFNSTSLKYDAIFADGYEAGKAEPIAHAQFSKELASAGLSFGEFNNKFSIIDNRLVVTLFASDGKFEDNAKSFFLIKTSETAPSPIKLLEYKVNYEQQGFKCKTTVKK